MPKKHRIAAMKLDVEDKIEAAAPAFTAAQLKYRKDCVRETSRVARNLQPRQRALVLKMHDALSLLSAAIIQERLLHDELAKTAPLPSSQLLPRCEPPIGSFSDWSSPASGWAKQMRAWGVLT
jgi:hypothetical protein